MRLKIVRNDITKMHVEAIVNTANDYPTVGSGCDHAIYMAAGYEELLRYRKEKIGFVPEGEVFITPGFNLDCDYIIHAVSPLFVDGNSGEEEKLRSCYKKGLQLALEHRIKSIAFPLISTGGFGYPKEEGFRIAVDEINAFIMKHEILVYLVVFDNKATRLGRYLYADLESYIDQNYVDLKHQEEYFHQPYPVKAFMPKEGSANHRREHAKCDSRRKMAELEKRDVSASVGQTYPAGNTKSFDERFEFHDENFDFHNESFGFHDENFDFYEQHEKGLEERMKHISDTFSEYLIYLIDSRGMTYPDVYKRAIVDKKVFSKIKNNPDAHPKKITAMCLCVGAKLNMDQTRDLLARAGYALSPCDKTDIIFSYFIEHHIYDMIELDIQLEEHGLPCLIS